jgi:hypothetical protein
MTDETRNTTDELGGMLWGQYQKAKADRYAIELRWLDDLRQFKGLYSPDELQGMDPERSSTFTRITRIKVKSATARLMDLVFPAGSEENWSIDPTPVPDMEHDPNVLSMLVQQLGRMPTPEEERVALLAQARVKAVNMEREIRDQLVDLKYRRIMKQVIDSGNLFGTGILKGPLVNQTVKESWGLDENGDWALQATPILTPFVEFVPVWESYPETQATEFSDAQFHFQRTVMPRHAVLELAARDDFSTKVIKQYLRDVTEGDVTVTHWENELRLMGWDLTGSTAKSKRYEVVEYWGVLEAQQLIDIGLDLPDESVEEFWANIWLLGGKVIKADVQPVLGMKLPYYAYYWDKDETSIFGEGISSIMRDDQISLNSCVRLMQDNAAIAGGPQFEANLDLLHPEEDYRKIHPFKVWARNGVGHEAQYPAVRVLSIPSHTAEYMQLSQFFLTNIHEATIPSYMHGEPVSKGSVGRTASGLSMLMSAAQITFKGQLFSLDDDVQRPFLEGMYHWNMQFNPKPEIKGDFAVHVKGTSSLVAREIRAQNLDQFANSTMNPMDAPFIDRHELNKQRAMVLELGDSIVMSKEQAMAKAAMQVTNDVDDTRTTLGAGAPQGGPEVPFGNPGVSGFEEGFGGDEGFAPREDGF